MERIGAKGITYPLLLTFLLQFSSLVGAVDIYAWSDVGCTGNAIACYDVPEDICCTMSDAISVQFANVVPCLQASVYNGGGCTNFQATGLPGCFDCTPWGSCTGADWEDLCPPPDTRRLLLSELKSERSECESQRKPNGVVFKVDGMNGNWELRSSNAPELYSQLENVPHAEKVNWLRSQNATYNPL